MKKILRFTTVILALTMLQNITFAQTTVANGNWSDPTTWGGMPPIGTGTVVINHTVTLDMDYSHTAGSITIGTNGALNGVSPMRGFALNYPSGTATITINGSMYIARTLLNSGTVTNSGTFQADSLLNYATITNNSSATINATQFMNNTGGSITNNGTISTFNFLNLETISNTGTIGATDMTNSKTLTNSSTGVMSILYNFLNSDTLASPAIFTNDGSVTVGHDFQNGINPSTIQGSGRFCVQNNTWNRGTMTGTFDFCDQTGGNLDLNTGSIGSGITYCAFPCGLGIEKLSESISFSVYPNPFSSQATLHTDYLMQDATLTIVNCYGQTVEQITNISGNTITLSRENLSNGLYFIRLTETDKTIATDRLVIAD